MQSAQSSAANSTAAPPVPSSTAFSTLPEITEDMIARAIAVESDACTAAETAARTFLAARAMVLRLSLLRFAQSHPAAAWFGYSVEYREDSSGGRIPWFSAYNADGHELDPDEGDDGWLHDVHAELADYGYSVEEAEFAFEAEESDLAKVSVDRLAGMLRASGFYL